MIGSLSSRARVDKVAGFDTESDAPIDAAFPADPALGKAMRMFFKEEGFSMAISHLLFEIFPGSGTAVVPDKGSSGKPERESSVAKPPAKVDVVSCGVKDGIEALDLREGGFFNGKMTAGQVFGGEVINHDVSGSARGCGGEGKCQRLGLRGEVWSADRSMVGLGISAGEPSEPLFVRTTIIISEGEDFAGCFGRTMIARGGESRGFKVEGADFLLLVQKFGRAIGRTVVDNDDFEVVIVYVLTGLDTGFDSAGTIAGADDDGEARWV